MRAVVVIAITGLAIASAGLATPAAARAASTASEPGPSAPVYGLAPWWMRTPIIAATGEVQTHVAANRAYFSAEFTVVDPSLDTATRQVSDRVRALAKTLQNYGAEKAQVETSLSITPIYQQYRDKQGELQTNERADRIDRYQASVRFTVQVHDLKVLERAYAATVSAHPASVQSVSFNLEPDNETNAELFKAATADAARRAKLAVDATGARLGRVMLIDPSNRACDTDVLVAGAPRAVGEEAGGVQEVVVDARRRAYDRHTEAEGAPPPPPPSAPGEEVAPGDLLPVQPPLETLQRKICVIYALE